MHGGGEVVAFEKDCIKIIGAKNHFKGQNLKAKLYYAGGVFFFPERSFTEKERGVLLFI